MKARLLVLWIHCLLLSVGARAQDLGPSAYSKLTWDHISTYCGQGETNASGIGLTTDKRMYVWGTNALYTIKTATTLNNVPVEQRAPLYVPSPVGETIKKVDIMACDILTKTEIAAFLCLSESGKLYGWGINSGLMQTAWPVPTAIANTAADTVRAKRSPVQLSILGESNFVDFDASGLGQYWVAIGQSGKAYHIGNNGGTSLVYTFIAMPNPAGVNTATFKYTNVWVSNLSLTTTASTTMIYLKGNDGKIYYTGGMASIYHSGVPSLYQNTSVTAAETAGDVRTIVPREVPFPIGEDIISIKSQRATPANNKGYNTYAISASGKAYATGKWRGTDPINSLIKFVNIPLKSSPILGTELDVLSDSTYMLKKFVEIATPQGATKILDIMFTNAFYDIATSVIGDNNKVYWSGTNRANNVTNIIQTVFMGNYLSKANDAYLLPDECNTVINASTNNYYKWEVEAINYEGASKFIQTPTHDNKVLQIGIISKTGRGYFTGDLRNNMPLGKLGTGAIFFSKSPYPIPIANEELLDCNPSPGSGGNWSSGPVTPTNTAVGTIDCSKTQIAPAPVAGVPSQTTLIVSVNVTTAGTFTPITVSGSGMSLGNGITSVTTSSTGVRTFYIPIQYDGSALTNTFQFTIGSAGSCTADLTKTPVKAITDVWSLECLPSVGPALKK